LPPRQRRSRRISSDWGNGTLSSPRPSTDTGRRARAAERRRTGRRADIEGLRGVAVLLVVAFHAGLAPFAGGFVGVDVFFVISGFLITGLLVDELRAEGSVSLVGFYARRIRRLLPLACLVLLAIAVAFRPLLAPIDRPSLIHDLRAAALWGANWHFAASSTNYMGTADQSPVLHYWSLSVEEQFYVVWPLLVLAMVRLGPRPRRWIVMVRRLTTGLSLITLLSLAASVLSTSSSGPWAYFGLHTRAWELAAGGLLTLARPLAPALPRIAAVLLGWAGIALVVGSALLLDRDTSYPGSAAIWPVMGAVLVVAGGTRTTDGPGHLLGGRLLTSVGRVSYGWYLWHWPCLMLARTLVSPAQPLDPDLAAPTDAANGPWPAVAAAAAVLVSLGLAVISHRLVEQPVRRSTLLIRSRGRTLAVGVSLVAAATALPALALTSPTSSSATTVDAPTEAAPADAAPADAAAPPSAPAGGPASSVGASTLAGTTGQVSTAAPDLAAPGHRTPTMSPERARADDTAPSRCFLGFGPTAVDPTCRFGDPNGSRVVVLFGDSHAAQWYPAMVRAASINHWTLYFWAKSGCGYADTPEYLWNYHRSYTECTTWRQAVLARIAALPKLDAVVVGRNYAQFSKLTDAAHNVLDLPAAAARWSAGSARVLTRLHSAARIVILLRDTPRPIFDVPACLSEHPGSPDRCDYPRAGHVAVDATLFASERSPVADAQVKVVDLSDLVCSTQPCPVVSTTGAILFRDQHHLTATFSREIGPAVAKRLAPVIGT
jgi:peptidoglycan/LPS O-acetylase OafA/YrhL